MAFRACTLEAPFPLCHMPDAILGVSQHDNEDNVIVTVQSTAVHVYNVPDQKCVTSWAVSPSTVLTHCTVQHPVSKLYYTVDNHKTLRSWQDGIDKIEAGAAKNYRNRIHAVHVHAHIDGAVLLFADGSAVQTDAKLVTSRPLCPAPRNIETGALPLYSTVATTGKKKDLYLLVVFASEAGPSSYVVQTYEIDTQTAALATKPLAQHTLETGEALVCAAYEEHSHTLSVLSAKGTLSVFPLPPIDAAEGRPLAATVVRHSALYMPSEPAKARPGKREKDAAPIAAPRAAMFAFDSAYVALVGESPSQKFVLSVWDIKFGTLQGQREMRTAEPEPRQAATHGNVYQIMRSASLARGAFVCTLGRYVDVSPVYCSEFNLAAAMACMRATASVLSAADAHSVLTPPMVSVALPVPAHVQDAAAWEQGLGGSGAAEQALLKAAAEPKTTAAAFKKAFDAYMASIQSGAEPNRAAHPAPHVIEAVLQRCTQSEQPLWVDDIVVALVRCGCVSAVACPELLSQASARDSLAVLESALLHVQDVPESDLVRIIQHVMQTSGEALDKHFAEFSCAGLSEAQKERRTHEAQAGVEHMLALVLSSPRNDVFMLSALKTLTYEHVMALLKHLRSWFTRYMANSDKRLRRHFAPTRIPTFKQVIEWAGLVLDAHMARLLLMSDSQQMLVDLKDIVQRQAQMCEAMQDLQAYMQVLDSRVHLPAMQTNSVYTVEVIHL